MTGFDPSKIKRNPDKARCSHITAGGERCKSWAMRDSNPPTCASHAGIANGGAPKGNQNALKHGFYVQSIKDDEAADLVTLMQSGELDDELAMTRVLIRRVWDRINDEKHPVDTEDFKTLAQLHFLGVRTVAGLIKAGGPSTTFQDVLGAVLDELSNSWGAKL